MFCLSSIYFAQVHAESVYKWVDTQGNTHYGDRSQGNATQTLRVTPPPPVDEASQQRLQALKKQGSASTLKKDALPTTAAEKPGPSKEEMEKNCSLAKENLAQLEGVGALLFETDKEGNRRLLTLEERSKTTETMHQETERWCK